MGKKSGFTLIELLVVVIIVAVLAAVGIPLLRDSIVQARASEAVAGLGAVRTAMRANYARFGKYTVIVVGTTAANAGIGVSAKDLEGHYFEDDDYTFKSSSDSAYCIGVTGDTTGTAPAGGEVTDVNRSMNAAGTIFTTADCS